MSSGRAAVAARAAPAPGTVSADVAPEAPRTPRPFMNTYLPHSLSRRVNVQHTANYDAE